jgi:para-aminobenzoate synthetase component 1
MEASMKNLAIERITLPESFEEAFDCLSTADYSFFLDSSMGERNLGRYSFIGAEPFLVFRSKGDRIELIKDGRVAERMHGNPFDAVKKLLNEYRMPRSRQAIPFTGGAVGYFAYDLAEFSIPTFRFKTRDDVKNYDCVLGFYDNVLARDNLTGETYRATCGKGREPSENFVRQPLAGRDASWKIKKASPNFTKQEYCKAVEKVKEYIAAGDIYQANLSQRFSAEFDGNPWLLYKKLRRSNPAPFAAYLNFPEVKVVCDSPERFLRIEGRNVETRPMKGTRPRGKTPKEDEKLRKELAGSVKDKAENLMIVDLERNDLGKVCEYGSVKVSELEVVETYPTVFQMVSAVRGRLRKGRDAVSCLKACFPGGSITGAPKVRAMEIIDEIEPTRRNIYTGAIGNLGFDGSMDVNIAIRTIIVKDEKAYVQVGGGIVADSKPDEEYEETMVKARALLSALKG